MSLSHAEVIRRFVKDGATKGKGHNMFIEGNILYDYGHHFPILIRRPDGLLMNADKYSVTTSKHQGMCQRYATFLIPFSILNRLHLDYFTVEILDQSKERWDLICYRAYNPDTKKYYRISVNEYKTFSGTAKEYCYEITERRPSALIMRNPENGKCYLASMDNDNYFASELSQPVKTVQEGYDLLKPIEAKGIEGKDYLRQGEWFFIPCDGVKPFKISIKKGMTKQISYRGEWNNEIRNYEGKPYKRIEPKEFLVNQNKALTPHHYATEYGFNIGYPSLVRGTVRHTNRDHRMLKLGNGKQWYMAVESNHVISVGVRRVD